MHKEVVLGKMREDYRCKDLASLKRHFLMSQWLLSEDDKHKIQGAIKKLEGEQAVDPQIQEALRLLGGRIVP